MHRPEIERALHFIGERLEQPITAAEVARAAHLSEFHLHRVFHAEVGESIGRFITRRRLELAALRLAYEPDRSITEIALGSGYGVRPRSRPTEVRGQPRGSSLLATGGLVPGVHARTRARLGTSAAVASGLGET